MIADNVLNFRQGAFVLKTKNTDRIAFTKASPLDGVKTTVTLHALAGQFKGDAVALKSLSLGSEILVTINSIKTVFVVNRKGRTAYTKAFPRTLRLPTVGLPVNANVTDVEILY